MDKKEYLGADFAQKPRLEVLTVNRCICGVQSVPIAAPDRTGKPSSGRKGFHEQR